jgi:hypothetical protein
MATDDVDVIVAKEIATMKYVPVAALASLLLAAPAFAQTAPATPAAKTPAAKTAAASKPAATPVTHATRGVVKTVDASSLVISARKGAETTFVLNASTQRQGDIAPGANVSVRYHTEGKDKVATAVSVQQPKQPAAAKSKASK